MHLVSEHSESALLVLNNTMPMQNMHLRSLVEPALSAKLPYTHASSALHAVQAQQKAIVATTLVFRVTLAVTAMELAYTNVKHAVWGKLVGTMGMLPATHVPQEKFSQKRLRRHVLTVPVVKKMMNRTPVVNHARKASSILPVATHVQIVLLD